MAFVHCSFRNAGKFYDDYVNLSETNYKKIQTIGSSTLTKGFTMPLDELNELISWAENGKTNSEIVTRVEKHVVPSLHWIADATYAMGYN